MQFLRWHLVFSHKPKFADAVFIKERGSNKFIGKVYGHDGQEALENAQLMVDAPDMLTIIRNLTEAIELTSKIVNGRKANGPAITSAHAMLRKHRVKI